MIAKNKFLILFVVLFSALTGYIVFQHSTKAKVGYVYIKEIYDGFEMKKQMEQKYLKTKKAKDKILGWGATMGRVTYLFPDRQAA